MEMLTGIPSAPVKIPGPALSEAKDPATEAEPGAEVVSFPTLLQGTQNPEKPGIKKDQTGILEISLVPNPVTSEEPIAFAAGLFLAPTELKAVASATSAPTKGALPPSLFGGNPTNQTVADPVSGILPNSDGISLSTEPSELKQPLVDTITAATPREESQESLPTKINELKTIPGKLPPAPPVEADESLAKASLAKPSAAKPFLATATLAAGLKPVLAGKAELPVTKETSPQEQTNQLQPASEIISTPGLSQEAESDLGQEQGPNSSWNQPNFNKVPSAEVEQLNAQAQAQKNYLQPEATNQAGSLQDKPTLADLGIDSVTSETQEKAETEIAKILSGSRQTTPTLNRNIRGQVLQQVVDHLQEEMGKEKLTIRLNPEKLGPVEVLFQTDGDNLKIVMSAGGSEAEKALQEGTRELSDSIANKSPRWNLVEIRVDNRAQDQGKQESRNDSRREKQGQNEKQPQHERRDNHQADNRNATGDWAAFHLGG